MFFDLQGGEDVKEHVPKEYELEGLSKDTVLREFTIEHLEELLEFQKQQQLQLERFVSRTSGFLCGAVLSLALAALFQRRL